MKHLEVRLKYSAARSIFNSLLGARVSSDVETLRLMPRGGGGVFNKCLNGEAPLRGPTPYPFIYHFHEKGTPFVYTRVTNLVYNFAFLLTAVNALPFKY